MSSKNNKIKLLAAACAFCALVPAASTFAAPSSIISGSGTGSTSSSGSTSGSTSSSTTTQTVPETSSTTTVTNPETADSTWILALVSLAVTAGAIGGRRYFAKH